jgi:hypothetical protein
MAGHGHCRRLGRTGRSKVQARRHSGRRTSTLRPRFGGASYHSRKSSSDPCDPRRTRSMMARLVEGAETNPGGAPPFFAGAPRPIRALTRRGRASQRDALGRRRSRSVEHPSKVRDRAAESGPEELGWEVADVVLDAEEPRLSEHDGVGAGPALGRIEPHALDGAAGAALKHRRGPSAAEVVGPDLLGP